MCVIVCVCVCVSVCTGRDDLWNDENRHGGETEDSSKGAEQTVGWRGRGHSEGGGGRRLSLMTH